MSKDESVIKLYIERILEVTRGLLFKYKQLLVLEKDQRKIEEHIKKLSEKLNYNKLQIAKLNAEIESIEDGSS